MARTYDILDSLSGLLNTHRGINAGVAGGASSTLTIFRNKFSPLVGCRRTGDCAEAFLWRRPAGFILCRREGQNQGPKNGTSSSTTPIRVVNLQKGAPCSFPRLDHLFHPCHRSNLPLICALPTNRTFLLRSHRGPDALGHLAQSQGLVPGETSKLTSEQKQCPHDKETGPL